MLPSSTPNRCNCLQDFGEQVYVVTYQASDCFPTPPCVVGMRQLSYTPIIFVSHHDCYKMVGSLYSQGLIPQPSRQLGPLQRQQHPIFSLFIVLCPFTPLKTLFCLRACSCIYACHTFSVPDKSVFSDHPQKHVPQYY